MRETALVSVRLLGELEVARGSRRLELPQSKKTRALLAFLVVTGRPHRRERLCELLWDVTDDPKGALRWSLSRLRTLVNEPGRCRIIADRNAVAFEPEGAEIDVLSLRDSLRGGIESKSIRELERLATNFRGEFLEGLHLPDFHHFHSWCIAEREQVRTEHAAVLQQLISRLSSQPQDALPHARALARIDPLNERAHAMLVRLLGAAGKRAEAEQQHAASTRLLKELGVSAWRACRAGANARRESSRGTLPWVAMPRWLRSLASRLPAVVCVFSPIPKPRRWRAAASFMPSSSAGPNA